MSTNDLFGLLADIGTLLAGIAALAALVVSKRNPNPPKGGGSAPQHGNPLLWTMGAAAFALTAFVLAAAVVLQGLAAHSQLSQWLRLTAECFGLLSTLTGFGIVLELRRRNDVTAEVGGLALFTGFVVLAGMAAIA